MMDLEVIKTELEALKKADLYEGVLELVESERTKGIEASRKKNSENQALRKYKTGLEQLGYTDGDVDEFVNSLANKRSGSNNDLTLKSLKNEIDNLKKERDNAVNAAKSGTIKTELSKALGDKVYGADLLIQSLISDGKVDLASDKVVFKNGDDIQSLEDGVRHILETRKDLVKNTQAPGAGTKKVSGTNNNIQAIIQSGDREAIRANITEIAAEYGIKMK